MKTSNLMTNLVEILTIFVKNIMTSNAPAEHSKLTQKAKIQKLALLTPKNQINGVRNQHKILSDLIFRGVRKKLYKI